MIDVINPYKSFQNAYGDRKSHLHELAELRELGQGSRPRERPASGSLFFFFATFAQQKTIDSWHDTNTNVAHITIHISPVIVMLTVNC